MLQALLRFHKGKLSGKHINNAKVLGKGLRKGNAGRGGKAQGKIGREQKNRCHCPGQQGIQAEAKKNEKNPLSSFPKDKEKLEQKIYHQKKADHNADIIIGKNGKCQAYRIKPYLSSIHHTL